MLRDRIGRECQNRYNELVSIFDTCDDYNELGRIYRTFILSVGDLITSEQKEHLELLLQVKRNNILSSRNDEKKGKSK